MNAGIKEALTDIVGPARVTDALIDMVSYSYDSSDHDHRPDAAVWPASTEQVSKILALAHTRGIPVIPRGAGTGLAGAAVPIRGGVVMDLGGMNRILDIRIADRQAVVQPGVVYADLARALGRFGFFFPPDPASSQACTLGGNVATNAGGIRGAKYGVTRDYVLGLEVVLADGRVMRTGSYCIKSASGYDLTRLFVGSEGTLGVITEITLKINPKPKAAKTGTAYFSDLEDAGRAVTDIMHSGIIPSVLEILDVNTIAVLREQAGMELPRVEAILLVETDGYTDTEASFQMDSVMEALHRNGAEYVRVAESAREAEELWKARKSASGAAASIRANNVSEDVTVPVSRVPELLTRISALVKRRGLPFVIFGHAGDGNLHPKIMYDRSDPEQVKTVRELSNELFALTCELGGTLTGEHGIGLAKAPYMSLEHDPVALEMMAAIKRVFDPANILNPGKMHLP